MLRTSDYDYALPEELIAQTPTEVRGASRLLALRRGAEAQGRSALEDMTFGGIVDLIPAGDLVVLNTTKVRHARLLGTRPSGAPAEVLLLTPRADGTWEAMGKPGSALRPGKRVTLGPDSQIETVEVLEPGTRVVRFIGLEATAAMAKYGHLPLPPYIARPDGPADEARYQTVYAEREGSVAAPTAGLHFTEQTLEALRRKGVHFAHVDLEVGAGTFKPVEVEDPAEHHMHVERFEIPEATVRAIAALRARGSKLWAVGTTVVRTLEAQADGQGNVKAGRGETNIFIRPPYTFQVVDHLITNFHLPRSTLLMLVAAFAGYEEMRAAYRHAIAERYRFYSYGDAMVIV
ncbi:MAG TPA: tRNA preQ1(34) S-adenosylmethionine ribosyltransferase-isomerase QueA [Gemmatimonadales bacterium]|nr:tRNA preQ1(34) S-adenosylmethionine ribosyltransferase-isomerase QueA [Gemmatimonadales bacterium]